MSRKEFNRDYFVRVRVPSRRFNRLVGYDNLNFILGDELFARVLAKVEKAQMQVFCCKPRHGLEITFYLH